MKILLMHFDLSVKQDIAVSMGSDSDGEAGDLVTANSDGMTGDVSTAKSINGMSDNDDEEVFTKSTRKVRFMEEDS